MRMESEKEVGCSDKIMEILLVCIQSFLIAALFSAVYYIPKIVFFIILNFKASRKRNTSNKVGKTVAEMIAHCENRGALLDIFFIILYSLAYSVHSYIMLDGVLRIIPLLVGISSILVVSHLFGKISKKIVKSLPDIDI